MRYQRYEHENKLQSILHVMAKKGDHDDCAFD